MVQGKTYKDSNGHYYLKDDCIVSDEEIKTEDDVQIIVSYEKMSKSKGNGVDPIVSLR
jgi:valyl-tRNA synthetase